MRGPGRLVPHFEVRFAPLEHPYVAVGGRVSRVQRHLRLGFLAPRPVEAILDGKQPSWCVPTELVERPRPNSWALYSRAFDRLISPIKSNANPA